MLRAYSPELTGWFDDFAHSGFPDAFGGIGRISVTANTFSAGPPAPGFTPCNNVILIILGSCQALSPTDLANSIGIKDMRRCPGANERGLTNDQLTQGGTVNCNPKQVPIGP